MCVDNICIYIIFICMLSSGCVMYCLSLQRSVIGVLNGSVKCVHKICPKMFPEFLNSFSYLLSYTYSSLC